MATASQPLPITDAASCEPLGGLRHRLGFDSLQLDLNAPINPSLAARIRIAGWLMLLSNAIFLINDVIFGYSALLWLVRALQVAAVIAGMLLVTERRSAQWNKGIALAVCSIVCLTMAVASTLRGTTQIMPLLASSFIFASASLIPWGWRPQLVVASTAGAAVWLNFYWLTGTLPWEVGPNGMALVISLGLSVLIAYQLHRQRLRLAAQQRDLLDAQRVAEEANRAKADFLAVMSHEIRTPMNAVIGLTDILLDSNLDGDQRRWAEAVRSSGDALMTIINDILDFSKLEAGKLRLENSDFSPRAVLDGVIQLFSAQSRDKEIELAAYVDPSVPAQINADAGRLRQILINLVSNAVKFTDTGDVVVSLTMRPGDGERSLLRGEVIDTGVGLNAQDQQRVFAEFSQIDMSTVRRHHGTGLGLAICRRLVAMMGGEIGVESHPGSGSTFWFTIGVRPCQAAVGRAGGGRVMDNAEDHRESVLVADDNPVDQRLAVRLLERLGYRAVAVGSGREAVAVARHKVFAAILMDCRMPGMDGYQASTAIRACQRNAAAAPRIIGMSSGEEVGAIDRCRAAGMDALIAKPVGLMQLGAALHRLDAKLDRP